MKKLKIILQSKYFFVIFLLFIALSFIRINAFNYQSIYSEGDIDLILKVDSIKYNDNNDIVIFDGKEDLISYYNKFPFNVGDIVKIKGEIKKIPRKTIPNSFDYQDYLRSKNIYYQLEIGEIILVQKNNNFLNSVKTFLNKRLMTMPNKAYFYAFILGNTSYFDKEVRNIYEKNGLVYLLSIGSLQIMFLIKIISILTRKLKQKKQLIIIAIILLIYFWLTNYVIGVIRSGLCYLLKKLLSLLKIKISHTNIILLVGILLLIIRPFYILEVGFQYSFFISLGLSIWKKDISKMKLKSIYQIGLLAFLFSFPITIYHNYEINLLTIIIGPIFMLTFNFILFPLSIITFIFPNIIPVFNFIVLAFEKINVFFNKIDFLTFIFAKTNFIILVIYFLLIVFIKMNKKISFLLIILIFFHLNINSFLNEKSITFLDVSQGDAIVIKNGNNIYLVDNGGSEFREYSDEIIQYVHSLGFKKIHKMFLTHGDTDHIGSSIELLKKIRIDSVYFNNNKFNNNELRIIAELAKRNIFYTKLSQYELKSNELLLKCFSYNLNNENDSSMVIYLEYGNLNILLMGDASRTTEFEILRNYPLPKIDVLKVGHHGSKTSSSIEFINVVNPKYSIISVGKNNRYGHPNKEVLSNLENSKIYRTDEDGSIMFKIKNSKLKIETCRP